MVKALMPLLAADLLLFTAVGIAVTAWLPMPWRGHLLAGAPALGAATLVVALHITSLLVGVRVGTVLVSAAAVASLLVRSLSCRWWRHIGRCWLLLAAALVAGALPMAFVIKPFRAAGPTVIQSANDAFYYVSLTDWLLDNSALTVPALGVDPPAYGNARNTLQVGLRLGEEMNEGAVAAVTGRDPINTWSTTTLMWLLFIPGACIGAFGVLGLHRAAGIVAGVLTAGSAVVAVQVLTQNSAGMLGILIAPIAIALWARYFAANGGPPDPVAGAGALADNPETPAEGSSVTTARPPLWLLAVMIDGLVGAYTEYLPIAGIGMLLYLGLRRPRLWQPTAVDVLKLAGLAVALGPLIWYDAARSLRVTASLGGPALGSPFLGVPVPIWVARLTGASSYEARTGLTLGIVLAAWLLAGILLAILWSPARTILACVLLNFIAVTLLLGSRLHYFAYGEYRAVGTGLPLLVFASVAGWAAGLQRLSRSAAGRTWVAPALAAAAVGGVLFLVANQRTMARQAAQDWPAVADEFNQSAAWAASAGGQGGDNVTAMMSDFHTQLWSMYALRKSPAINFPFLYSGYALVPPLTYDDGRLRRYVLLGGDLFTQIEPSMVVASNARFRYLDVSRGTAVLALGVENFHDIEVTPQHRVQQWVDNDGRLLVAHTSDVKAVTLTLRANPLLGSVPVTISADGGSGQVHLVGQTDLRVTVPLGQATMSLVEIHNHVRAAPLYATDLRPLSVLLEAVEAG